MKNNINLVTEHFSADLEKVENVDLREVATNFLAEAVPDYFWHIGASSTGKFHPAFSQGEGGLVRHTKAVLMFLDELLSMSSYSYMKQEYKDYALVACLLHDTFKYGDLGPIDKESKAEYKNHASRASKEFYNYCSAKHLPTPSEYLLNAMTAHMGQWTTEKEDSPFTAIDRVVHLADYIASRNFIDIPELSTEKNTSQDFPFAMFGMV